jgi:hypothetical protein
MRAKHDAAGDPLTVAERMRWTLAKSEIINLSSILAMFDDREKI